MGHRILATGVVWVVVAAAVPVGAAPAAPVVPASVAPTWSWHEAWSRCAETASATGLLVTRVPGQVETFAAELQVRWRDAARRTADLFAHLVPRRAFPDLQALAASPVPGVESSGFGWRSDPINRRNKFHRGTDYRADRGTPVYAAGTGVVAFTGRQRGYGNVIYIDHGGGLVTRYAHLARIEVAAGTPIAAAGRIGQVGSTGRTTGSHLHFEVRLDGRALDPVLAMHVAKLARTDPEAAWLAAQGLAPEAQVDRVDRHDPPRGTRVASRRGARPERTGAPTRSRRNW